MASKWKVSDADTFFEVYSDEQSPSYSLLSENEAYCLAEELDELEAYREERRWRRIGEEWPEDGQYCQLGYEGYAEGETVAFAGDASQGIAKWVTYNHTEYIRAKHGFTHWRPVPMDVPKGEG